MTSLESKGIGSITAEELEAFDFFEDMDEFLMLANAGYVRGAYGTTISKEI